MVLMLYNVTFIEYILKSKCLYMFYFIFDKRLVFCVSIMYINNFSMYMYIHLPPAY